MEMSGLSRGFSICCLRFKNGVATTPARLASGWLARLYREGVEPSGSPQKVSDHILIPLFWIYPGATKGLPSSLVQLCTAGTHGGARVTRPTPVIRVSVELQASELQLHRKIVSAHSVIMRRAAISILESWPNSNATTPDISRQAGESQLGPRLPGRGFRNDNLRRSARPSTRN
jgi:hypothetical protein